jgi:hypothetical protein
MPTTYSKEVPADSISHVTLLKGASNYTRWRREFLVYADTEGVLSLFRNPSPQEKIETMLPSPGEMPNPPSLSNEARRLQADTEGGSAAAASVMAELERTYRSDMEIFKFRLKRFEKQQDRIRLARKLLTKSVDISLRQGIAGKAPAEAWVYLKQLYQMPPAMAQSLLYQEAKGFNLANFGSVQEYLTAHTNNYQDLEACGAKVDESQKKSNILQGLTKPYNRVIEQAYLDEGSGVRLTVDQIAIRLLTMEALLAQRKVTQTDDSKAEKPDGAKRKKESKRDNNKKSDTCPNCKKKHPGGEEECWFLHPEKDPWKNGTKGGPAKGQKKLAATADTGDHTEPASDDAPKKIVRKIAAMVDVAAFHKWSKELRATDGVPTGMPPPSPTPDHQPNSTQTPPEPNYLGLREKELAVRVVGGGGPCLEENCYYHCTERHLEVSDHNVLPQIAPDSTEHQARLNILTPHLLSFFASVPSSVDRTTWLVDTGANGHVVNDLKWFVDFTPIRSSIGTANTGLDILGVGTICFTTTTSSGEDSVFTLSETVYAPDARCNLISGFAICDKANLSAFHNNEHYTLYNTNREEVLYARAENGLFKVEAQTPPLVLSVGSDYIEEQMAATIDFDDPVWKWHRRLGHLGLESMRKLLKSSEGMELTDKQLLEKVKAICPVCATTRALVRIPRSPARRRFRNMGELVHIDTWGPYPIEGFDGTRLFVFITDDATRFTWHERLSSKGDLAITLLRLHRKIERTHNIVIRRYRADNEFVQSAIVAYTTAHGITMEPIVPYAHHQSGTAERNHRTVRDKASAMLQELEVPEQISRIITGRGEELLRTSSIPENLWPEAFAHAVWLKNRSPTKSHKYKKTPFELVEGRLPDLTLERIWGSRAYVTIPPEKRVKDTKLQSPRGWLGYFVGRESETIYHIWHPEQKKVLRVSPARIEDGEGLDDRHDMGSLTDRVPLPEIEENSGELESSSAADDSGDDTDDSELSSINNSIIQEFEENGVTQTPDMTAATFTAVATRARATKYRKSKLGRTIPSQGVVDEDLAEGGDNDTTYLPQDNPDELDFDTTKRVKGRPVKTQHMYPDSSKCDYCFQYGHVCDGERPCRRCVVQNVGGSCKDQTPATKALVPLENRGLPDRATLVTQTGKNTVCKCCHLKNRPSCGPRGVGEKCWMCVYHDEEVCTFEYSKKEVIPLHRQKMLALVKDACQPCRTKQRGGCDGNIPCGHCQKTGERCYQNPRKDYVPVDQKCGTCFSKGRGCSGGTPCLQCLQQNVACKPQGWQELPKCDTCCSQQVGCDRQHPCAKCIQDNRANCTYTNEQGTILRSVILKEASKTNLSEDEVTCRNCKRTGNQCDGNQPCYACVRYHNPKENRFCVWDLVDNKFEKYRVNCYTLDEDKKIVWNDDYEEMPLRQNAPIRSRQSYKAAHQEEGQGMMEQLSTATEGTEEHPEPNRFELRFHSQPYLQIWDAANHDVDESLGPNIPERFRLQALIISARTRLQDCLDQDENWEEAQSFIAATQRIVDLLTRQLGEVKQQASSPDIIPKDKILPGGRIDSGPIHRMPQQEPDFSFLDEETDPDPVDGDLEAFITTMEPCPTPITPDDENIDMVPELTATVSDTENHTLALLSTTDNAESLPMPRNFKEAVNGPEGDSWRAGIESEYDSLMAKGTWEVVDLPPGRKALTLKWVLKKKIASDGKVARFKARLCARGFQQREGIDFHEVFATVVKPTTYRLLFVIAFYYSWTWVQWDVATAFLNSDLDEEIYAQPPEGFPETHKKVLKFKKAIYGLKQSPRLWYQTLKKVAETLGFIISEYDPCLFIYPPKLIFIMVYVDNINVVSAEVADITEFKDQLFNTFNMTVEDETYFLGMNIERADDSLRLHQQNAIDHIVTRFNLSDLPDRKIPMTKVPTARETIHVATKQESKEYLQKVGSLIYPAQITRPDIGFATSVVGRFSANPEQSHTDAVHNIIAYMKANPKRGLVYRRSKGTETRSPLRLEGYVDSDFGGCPETYRSTTGWVFMLAGGPISWCSQRQKTVSLSTTEAEYVAASEATKEAVWLKGLINELGVSTFVVESVPLYIDNNSAMKLSKNAEFHARTKHINVKYHFIREQVEEGTVVPTRVATDDNIADVFTKPLPRPAFEKNLERMGML